MATTNKGFPYPTPTDPDKPRIDLEALAEFLNSMPGVRAGTEAERDVLTELWEGMLYFNLTAHRLEINRSGTAGDWAWVIDGSQPVPVAAGGTGMSVAPTMLVNLATTAPDSPLKSAPRPGVTGTLPVTNGGHGGTTPAATRTNLDVYSKAEIGDPETNFVQIFETALNA